MKESTPLMGATRGQIDQNPTRLKTQGEIEASRLQELFATKGLETSLLQIPDGEEYREAIIFKREVPAEKMVRLYRGVGHLDESLLDQTPYAMRAAGSSRRAVTVEEVRSIVETLAETPTYDNLMAYVSAIQPYLNQNEVEIMNTEVMAIEEGILEGISIRKELIHRQIHHVGGVSEHGVTPYVSASFDPIEAKGYGRRGIVIIDIPVSRLGDFREVYGEVNIKGAIDKKYVVAILVRDPVKQDNSSKKTEAGLTRAVSSVTEMTNTPLYTLEELNAVKRVEQAGRDAADRAQWGKDVERVRELRSKRLIEHFHHEIQVDFAQASADAALQGVDVYTAIRHTIYDHLASRLKQITKFGPEERGGYRYEPKSGAERFFSRAEVDDDMLVQLEKLVLYREEREARRKQ